LTRATRITRVGVALAGVLLLVLVATGAWLWWNYRPGPDHWVRVVHQVAAAALLALATALAIVAIVRRGTTGARGVVAGAAVLVSVSGAYVLGRLLPWNRIALSEYPRPGDSLGVAVAFSSRVQYLLLGDRQVSPSTYRWWAIAHLALSVLVVLALVLLWLRTREGDVSRRSRPPAPAEEPAG
jgi:hypothetical protein